MKTYTDPVANGYIMEAKACAKIEKDLLRLADKYAKAVKREEAARKQQLEQAMQYRSFSQIQNDYGWDIITEKQYELYVKIFEEGEEAIKNHPKTVNEIAHSIICTMCGSVSRDRMQWEFEALLPEEQEAERKRAEESNKKWKVYIAELKKKRRVIEHTI